MTLLTVNAGSSSLRLTAFSRDGQMVATRHHAGTEAPPAALEEFLSTPGIDAIEGVAHRIVHGGERLVQPCLIDVDIEAEIARLAPLAPLHNPAALKWIRLCRALLGAAVPQVAVFDTAFYAQLPEVARRYALPKALVQRHGLRRVGFHGLAHEAMWRRWRALRPDIADGGRVISIQLGAGCSVTAIDRGRAVDTSMGFTPLEGLVMATRCGDVDPGLLAFLQRAEGLTSEQLERLLNDQSGLLGLSGESADMKRLLASSQPDARLAIDVYCYRVRKYIGAYWAVLGDVEAILFGGGVGEQAPIVRRQILAGLESLGIVLDVAANEAARGTEARISHADSRVAVWVTTVDEAGVLARMARTVIAAAATRSGAHV
ncbi:MAG TPA: acetate/propionate family kinase [Burkholderiales bacterium]|nr:acetate/propionate family kinase [Burkholderiales bacterium]